MSKSFLTVLIPSFLYLFIWRLCDILFEIELPDLIKDNPFFIKYDSPLYGLISNIGIFLWIVSLSMIFTVF